MSKIKMNAWQATVEAFKVEGVKYIFGLPGGDTFYDAIADSPEIQAVPGGNTP